MNRLSTALNRDPLNPSTLFNPWRQTSHWLPPRSLWRVLWHNLRYEFIDRPRYRRPHRR